jgi:hypothetical protein
VGGAVLLVGIRDEGRRVQEVKMKYNENRIIQHKQKNNKRKEIDTRQSEKGGKINWWGGVKKCRKKEYE